MTILKLPQSCHWRFNSQPVSLRRRPKLQSCCAFYNVDMEKVYGQSYGNLTFASDHRLHVFTFVIAIWNKLAAKFLIPTYISGYTKSSEQNQLIFTSVLCLSMFLKHCNEACVHFWFQPTFHTGKTQT